MDQVEIWKPISGYEGRYEVSTLGRIKSLQRVVESVRNGKKIFSLRKERIMRPSKSPNGYRIVTFHTNGVAEHGSVHVIVANNFIPNPLNLPVINHIDGNKENNEVSNLERCTQSENSLHAYRTGIRIAAVGSRVNGSKLDELQVRVIKSLKGLLSSSNISNYFKVSAGNINCIYAGKTWKHII